MALKKSSVLYSVVKFKCPQCHEGDFFVSHPYDLKNIGKVNHHCSECGLKFAKEPGFYFGAMYVSYGFGVALFVAIVVLYWLIFQRIDVWILLGIMAVASILVTPLSHALSKIIWAKIFIRYRGQEAIDEYKNAQKVEAVK
ncbi:MAG TPA: DUF983 domain-containing protein [Taishania sp.]|nr:DUF983 domain-containing protein [Taishania sp.]